MGERCVVEFLTVSTKDQGGDGRLVFVVRGRRMLGRLNGMG